MAKFIEIKDGALSAKIAPNNGGMVLRLAIDGMDVLKFNEDEAELHPVKAGGAPVMFPFPSRTKNDTYTIDGREYYMPMHGLVKNAAFAVKSVEPNAVTVWCDGSESQRQAHYPFDYVLEIEYRLSGNSFITTARVTNRSDKPMPHYLGWHTYFITTDKSALKFEHSFTARYDWHEFKDIETVADIDFTQRWDDVFHTPEKKEVTLYNKPDGYKARYILDDAHNVMVVVANEHVGDSAICLEPWCGVPDSINIDRFVKYVQPGETETYTVELEIEKY